MIVPLLLAGGAAALELKRAAHRAGHQESERTVALKAENEELRAEIERVRVEMEQKQVALAEQMQRLGVLEEENQQLRGDNVREKEELAKQRQELDERVERLLSKQRQLESCATTLQEENEELQKKWGTAQAETLKAVEEARSSAKIQLAQQVAEVLERFSGRQLSVEELEQQLLELECRLCLTEEQRTALQAITGGDGEEEKEEVPLELTIDDTWQGHGLRLALSNPALCAERLRSQLSSACDASPAVPPLPPLPGSFLRILGSRAPRAGLQALEGSQKAADAPAAAAVLQLPRAEADAANKENQGTQEAAGRPAAEGARCSAALQARRGAAEGSLVFLHGDTAAMTPSKTLNLPPPAAAAPAGMLGQLMDGVFMPMAGKSRPPKPATAVRLAPAAACPAPAAAAPRPALQQ